jgi:hypothetical protein
MKAKTTRSIQEIKRILLSHNLKNLKRTRRPFMQLSDVLKSSEKPENKSHQTLRSIMSRSPGKILQLCEISSSMNISALMLILSGIPFRKI